MALKKCFVCFSSSGISCTFICILHFAWKDSWKTVKEHWAGRRGRESTILFGQNYNFFILCPLSPSDPWGKITKLVLLCNNKSIFILNGNKQTTFPTGDKEIACIWCDGRPGALNTVSLCGRPTSCVCWRQQRLYCRPAPPFLTVWKLSPVWRPWSLYGLWLRHESPNWKKHIAKLQPQGNLDCLRQGGLAIAAVTGRRNITLSSSIQIISRWHLSDLSCRLPMTSLWPLMQLKCFSLMFCLYTVRMQRK